MRKLLATMAAALVVVAPAAVLTRSAGADPAVPVAPGVATGPAGIGLLSQSPFVESGQAFHLQLQVSAPAPTDRVEVVIGYRITTRSGFDAVLKSGAGSSTDHVFSAAASSLPSDASGGVDVDIPINPTTSTTISPFTITREDSGVFPVTVEILDGSERPVGSPLTTFMVYASPSSVAALGPGAASTGLPRLDVALNVPVRARPTVTRGGQVGRLSPADSAALAAEATALAAHPTVPVTLAASGATLDGLATGTSTDRATLAALASLAAGDQVAAAPYAPVSMPALAGADLGSEITAQLDAGRQAVATDLGHQAASGTVTSDAPLDETTLADLTAAGVNQLVVPSSALSPLTAAESQTTLASPTGLSGRGATVAKVVSIDPALTAHFTGGPDPVLEASRLLAELAMIQLETPGEHRGVAVVPPASWPVDPTFLSTVLTGLTANPLLDPVPTTGLFALPELGASSSSLAGSSSAGSSSAGSPVTRSLVAARPTVAAYPLAGSIRTGRQAATATASIFPGARAQAASAQQAVLVAESADVPEAGQRALVASVTAPLTRLRRAVNLPGGTSITLTARDGEVPITVVAGAAATGARIRLQFTSGKLAFRSFRPPGGSCSSPTIGEEECELTLASEATTLKIPVVARASGVFTMAVALTSPDSSVVLGQTRDTVRSTAFSGVGVVIMVVAVIGLAYWWIRNIRHGRRARALVPPSDEDPTEDPPDDPDDVVQDPEPPLPPPAEEGSWLDEDPVIAEFFSSPAPSYPPGGLRASRSDDPAGRDRRL